MLEACGLESTDFYDDEKILTRENLEKNYKFLIKMVDVRQPGDVKGFFMLCSDPNYSKHLYTVPNIY